MARVELVIKDTHRGLLYEDGSLVRVLDAGRYAFLDGTGPWDRRQFVVVGPRRPITEVVVVDVRERELTLKGQEILTADKVAVRVNILVQFRVTDPKAATHEVESYEDRLYSDVQLAARRSLASTTLEEILTNRNRLSEDILSDVKEIAARYGVAIVRADVKDLTFPGNLQEVMNRVLAAERMSQAQLVEARTKAQTAQIEAQAKAEIRKVEASTEAEASRLAAAADAEGARLRAEAEVAGLRGLEETAATLEAHPVLLRLREIEALGKLAKSANARIYIGFDKHQEPVEGA